MRVSTPHPPVGTTERMRRDQIERDAGGLPRYRCQEARARLLLGAAKTDPDVAELVDFVASPLTGYEVYELLLRSLASAPRLPRHSSRRLAS